MAGGIEDVGVEWSRVCKFKIREIFRMFEDENQRLQTLAQACDRLKATVLARTADLAMSYNEVNQHQEYLTTVSSHNLWEKARPKKTNTNAIFFVRFWPEETI